MSTPVTLDKFYSDFQKFVEIEAKRWENNDKKWMSIEKRIRQMDKKIDRLFDYLDREIMSDRKRIDHLEDLTVKPVFPK